MKALEVDPIMTKPLAPSERRTRDELITASDAYFEGMEKGTPFDPDCKRIENGVVTANDPGNAKQISRIPCGAQFATGFTRVITKVQERRYPVVDEERGLVWAFIRFDHAGKDKTITYNDGSVHPVNTPFDEPFSFQDCSRFAAASYCGSRSWSRPWLTACRRRGYLRSLPATSTAIVRMPGRMPPATRLWSHGRPLLPRFCLAG